MHCVMIRNLLFMSVTIFSLWNTPSHADLERGEEARKFFRGPIFVQNTQAHSMGRTFPYRYLDYLLKGLTTCGIDQKGLACLDQPNVVDFKRTWINEGSETIFEMQSGPDQVITLVRQLNDDYPVLFLTIEFFQDPLKGKIKSAQILTSRLAQRPTENALKEAYLERNDRIRIRGENGVKFNVGKRIDLTLVEDPIEYAFENFRKTKDLRESYHLFQYLIKKFPHQKEKILEIYRKRIPLFSEGLPRPLYQDYYLLSHIRICTKDYKSFFRFEDCLPIVEKGLIAHTNIDRVTSTEYMVKYGKVGPQVLKNLRWIAPRTKSWALEALFRNRKTLEDDLALIEALGHPDERRRVLALPYIERMELNQYHVKALEAAKNEWFNNSFQYERGEILRRHRYWEKMDNFIRRAKKNMKLY